MSSIRDPVYRELAKTDKSKKGSANLNNVPAAASGSSASAPPNASKKPGAVPSISASPAQLQQQNVSAPVKLPLKARVKVKATAPPGAALPASDGDVPMGESSSDAIVGAVGPDEDSEEYAGHPDQDDQDMAGDDPAAMEEYDEQYEGEEPVDTMQVEEEELRRDALGVEERGGE